MPGYLDTIGLVKLVVGVIILLWLTSIPGVLAVYLSALLIKLTSNVGTRPNRELFLAVAATAAIFLLL